MAVRGQDRERIIVWRGKGRPHDRRRRRIRRPVDQSRVSFYRIFLQSPQARAVPLRIQLFAPYPRVVALHLTILGGGVLWLIFEGPAMLLLLLIALKIAVDLSAHIKNNPLPALHASR